MATSDLITDGKSFILSVINSTENLSVNLSDVTFGPPVKPTGALPLRNTKVIITPKSYSGYYGVKTVWYNRIHINQLGTIKVPKGIATHVVQLIPAINEKYGIFLTDDDIIDDVLPVFQTGEITVNLQISPNSYMFYSGDVIITQDFDPGVSGFNLIPSVWDTDYKSTLITNSSELNSLQVINSDPGISMIRTNNSFQTGKRYFEFSVPSDNGVIGLATAAAGMDVLIGSDENSFGIYPFEGKIRHNNQVVYTTNQLPLFGNRTIGVMVDLDNATLGFILQGNIRVDVPNVILPTAPLYVVVGNSSDTKILNNQLTNFGQIPFKYTVPVGYVPGFGIGGSPVVPTAGALIRTKCVGFTKVGIYANGAGGTYSDVIENNSAECGYGMTTPSTTISPVPTSTSTSTSSSTGTQSTSTTTTTIPTTSVTPTPTQTSTDITTTSSPGTTAAPTALPNAVNMGIDWVDSTPPNIDVNTGRIYGAIHKNNTWIIFSVDGTINTTSDFITYNTNTSLKDKMADLVINDPASGDLYPGELSIAPILLLDGIYFVSGNSGWLHTSTDLTNWNSVNISSKYNSISDGGPVLVIKIDTNYVAMPMYWQKYGVEAFISSPDGITWETYTNGFKEQVGGNWLRGITKIGNYYYCYLAQLNNIYRSSDGITWVEIFSSQIDKTVTALAGDGNRLVAILGTEYKIAYSDDNGDTWNISTGLQSMGWPNQDNAGATKLTSLIFANDRFVVVGSFVGAMFCATSTDGITWTKSGDLDQYGLIAGNRPTWEGTKVIYGSNKLMVFSGTNKLAVSPYINAPTTTPPPTTTLPPINLNLTWTTTTIPSVGYAQIVNMFYNAGKYVLINNGAGITTSDNDFSTVTVISTLRDKVNEVLPGELDNSFQLQKYVSFFENGYYCALSRNGWLFTSNDLNTWNAINVNDILDYTFGGFGGSVYCPSINKQLIVCIDGSVIASSDYINWTPYTDSNIDQFFSFTTMRRIIKLNNFYYAYSWNDTGSYSESFVRSTDGITWSALTDLNTKVVDALGNTSGYLSLATNGTRLVMLLGTAYLTAHSDDNGDTWSIDHNLQSLGWDANLTSSKTLLANIEYIDGRFVVVGGKQPNTWMAFSLDGITWERHTAIESSNILAPRYWNYDAMDVISSGTDKYIVYANIGKIATSFAVNLTPPTSSPTPTFPPEGTVIGTPTCQGFDKVAAIADGAGGSYTGIIEANSPECGYGTTAPTTTVTPPSVGNSVDLGTTWEAVDVTVGSRIDKVIYDSDNNTWVTFSKNGEITTSTDLVTFTENLTLKDKMADLAANDPRASYFIPSELAFNATTFMDGVYFVSGNNGWLYTSYDLTTWDAVNIYDMYGQTSGDQPIATVFRVTNQYIAALKFTNTIGFISTTDGINWVTTTYSDSLITELNGNTLSIDSIVNLNGKYFAIVFYQSSYNLITSPDGVTWTFHGGLNTNLKSMASNGTRLVGVRTNQYMTAYSDDNGDTWTNNTGLQSVGWPEQNIATNTKIENIIYAGDRFIAVGVLDGVAICATSYDGINWTKSDDLASYALSETWFDGWEAINVTYGDNKLVLSAGKNTLGISPVTSAPTTTELMF